MVSFSPPHSVPSAVAVGLVLMSAFGLKTSLGKDVWRPATVLQEGVSKHLQDNGERFFSLSADSRVILLGRRGEIWVFDLSSRKLIFKHTLSGGVNLKAAIDPSGRYLLTCRNQGHGWIYFAVLDLITGKEVCGESDNSAETLRIKTGSDRAATFQFSEDSVLCELMDGAPPTRVLFKSHQLGDLEEPLAGTGLRLQWDGHNQFTLKQEGQVVDRFSLQGLPGVQALQSCGGHYLPDGRLLAYGRTETEVVVMDVFAQREVLRRSAMDFFVSPESSRMAIRTPDGSIEILKIPDGTSLGRTRGSWPFVLSSSGRALAAWNPSLEVVTHTDLESRASVSVPWPVDDRDLDGPISLAYSRDDSLLAIAGKHTSKNPVRLVRTSDGKPVQAFPEGWMGPVAYHPEEGQFYGTEFSAHCEMRVAPLLSGNESLSDNACFSIVPNSYRMTGLSFSPGRSGFYVADGWRDGQGALVNYRRNQDKLEELWHIPGRFFGKVVISGARAFVSRSGGGLFLFDPQNPQDLGKQISIYLLSDGLMAAVNGRGEYFAPPAALRLLGFARGNEGYAFEQFDVMLNRPDRLLEALGAPKADIAALNAWRRERLRKLSFDPDRPPDLSALPTCRIREKKSVPFFSNHGELAVAVDANSSGQLSEWRAYVNNVPVLREPTPPGSARDSRTLTIPLGQGRNKVEISVLSDDGLESIRDTLYCNHLPSAPTLPSLYVLAIGVSDYADDSLDLDVAHEDARALARQMGETGASSFNKVHVKVLTDQQATRESILAAGAFLRQSTVDDQVVIFLAGHGLQDPRDLSYWFGTVDIDAENPRDRGLAYDAIEGLFIGAEARQRLLLLDTCFAGETYSKELLASLLSEPGGNISLAGGKVQARAPKRATRAFASSPAPGVGAQTSPSIASGAGIFADLRRSTGATVLTASGGVEFVFALELEALGNGVFTHCFIKGLRDLKADTNGDGVVLCSEMSNYLTTEIARLTEGQQLPSTRGVNLETDFPIGVAAGSDGPLPTTRNAIPAPNTPRLMAGRWEITEEVRAESGSYRIVWIYDLFADSSGSSRWMGASHKDSVNGQPATASERRALANLQLQVGEREALSGKVWESNGLGRHFRSNLAGIVDPDGRSFKASARDANTGEFSANFQGRLLEPSAGGPQMQRPLLISGNWIVRELMAPELGGWDIEWRYNFAAVDEGGLNQAQGGKVRVNSKPATRGEQEVVSNVSLRIMDPTGHFNGDSTERNARGRIIAGKLSGTIAPNGRSFIGESRDPASGKITASVVGRKE